MIKVRIIILSLVVFTLILSFSCGESQDTPRSTVIRLFGAMERNDRAAMNDILDLPSLMNYNQEDYALNSDSARVFHSPDEVLDDLTEGGLTYKRWFALQRIIGRAELKGDTAFVDISFIDKTKEKQYFNKFGLHKINGRWKIYSFRTI